MPWKVVARDGQFCVVVSEGPKAGKEVKCHPTREAALRQVRALYANVEDGSSSGKQIKRLPYG
jgi:hypothetical protein